MAREPQVRPLSASEEHFREGERKRQAEAEERAGERQPQGVSREEAERLDQEMAEARKPKIETLEPPASAPYGTHPLKPIEDNPAALRAYRGGAAAEPDNRRVLYHRNAYGGVVGVLE